MAAHLYHQSSDAPYRLSRSKLQLFLDCARCFYLDRRQGVKRPDMPAYTLNNAVDLLLKREFDEYRARGEPHPLMQLHGVNAVPFRHPELERWREALRGGIEVHDEPTGFLLTGAPDDLWEDADGRLIVVDYKATSTDRPITLEGEYREAYKRQLEFYGWLLKRRGFTVAPIGYFLFANARRDRSAFERTLQFEMRLLPYEGNDDWVEDAIRDAHSCLQHDTPPPATNGCRWCAYRKNASSVEKLDVE
jgi:hypothetical protein